MDTLRTITINTIRPNKDNPRRKINADELTELSQSIAAVGLLQPITVREKVLGHSDYEIVCGHRRFEAAKMAGLSEVPCIVRELTDEQAYEVMITENLQRKDIDPFDEAAAFASMKAKGYDVPALAERFGKSQSYIYGRIKLTDLIQEFVDKYEADKIQLSHCMLLSRLAADMQHAILGKYYCGDYYDMSNKPVSALESTVKSTCIELSHQYIDTDGCKGCYYNTATGAIFQDMCVEKCMNMECFAKKYVDAVYPFLEEARRANPDLFILVDKYRRPQTTYDLELEKKLKDEGFEFREANSYEYTLGDKKNKFDHQGKAACFVFGYEGFMFERTDAVDGNSSQAKRKYKNEWQLDQLAKDPEGAKDEIRRKIVEEDIDKISDDALMATPRRNVDNVLRATLYYLLQGMNTALTVFGLETGHIDNDDMVQRIEQMRMPELCAAIAALVTSDTLYMDYSTTLVERLFPEEFNVEADRIERAYLDKCRQQWYNYDDLTDEMIKADLEERLKK